MKFGVRLRSIGEIWGPSTLCRSVFWVCLRYAGQSLGFAYAMQVKLRVGLRYAGQFSGVRLRSTGEFFGSVHAPHVENTLLLGGATGGYGGHPLATPAIPWREGLQGQRGRWD